MIYYFVVGSGVVEVRVIFSGFVFYGFLGFKMLLIKSLGLIFSVVFGLLFGKEGLYVYIVICVGNIVCRLFSKYDWNDVKRREVFFVVVVVGVVVVFGVLLGGVLFGLEEVVYFFFVKMLFRMFFCCIMVVLMFKFLNFYGMYKIVMF